MIPAPELAARLVDSRRGVTPERIRKLVPHLKNAAHYRQLLEALPEAHRAAVARVLLPRLPPRWGLEPNE